MKKVKLALVWFSRQAFLTLLGLTVMCLVFWGVRTVLLFWALWQIIGGLR